MSAQLCGAHAGGHILTADQEDAVTGAVVSAWVEVPLQQCVLVPGGAALQGCAPAPGEALTGACNDWLGGGVSAAVRPCVRWGTMK